MKQRIIKSEEQQHFSLRKLTVGVASVLLGTTFMAFGGQTVHADSNNAPSKPAPSKANNNVDKQSKKLNIVEGSQDKVAPKQEQKVAPQKAATPVPTQVLAELPGTSTISDDDPDYESVNPDSVADKGSMTDQEALEILGYNGKELSDAQLQKLGITRNTYSKNGVKYTSAGRVIFTDTNGKTYKFTNIAPLHHADGSMQSNEEMADNANWNAAIDSDVDGIDIQYQYAPVAKGGTIYVNKGHALDSSDAYRGLPKDIESTFDKVSWDTDSTATVNTNQVGKYDSVVDVTYKSKLGQSVGVGVVVVDLQGKDRYTHIGADIPTAQDSVTGEPTGSKVAWSKKPSTDKPGDSTGVVIVTYPDGNTGTANSVLHVIAPQPKQKIEVWQGDPIPTPDTAITNTTEIANKVPGTSYTWQNTPSTAEIGETPATVVTHWPDDKTTTSNVTIVVKNPLQTITEGSDTTKEVSRDIYTKLAGQSAKQLTTQKVTIKRTGTKNLKTNTVTWNPWQKAELSKYDAPTIKNYVVSNPDAGKAVSVDGSQDKLADVVFNYTPATQTVSSGKDTEKTVSRDIYTQIEGQVPKQVGSQSVTLYRTGTRNLVSGAITWNPWQKGTIAAYPAPKIAGYQVSNALAGKAISVDGSKAKLDDVVFNYTALEHNQVINYVDINNPANIVSSSKLTGKTSTSVSFTPTAPTNWVIAAGQNIPTKISFGTSDNQPISILVDHAHQFDLKGNSKDFSRTVQYVNPETKKTVLIETQSATLTRSVDTDLVTGQKSYGQWTTGVFKQINAPTFVGYSVVGMRQAPAEVVNINSQEKATVTFTYAPNVFDQAINYVDKDSKQTVGTAVAEGTTDSTVEFDASAQVPADYELAQGQDSSLTIKFGKTQVNTPVVVYVVAQVQPVYEGTTKDVKRNIFTKLDNEPQILYDVQDVVLTRTGQRNLVTGKVTYTKWQAGEISAYKAPEIPNYTVQDPNAGMAVSVDGSQDKIADVVFNYTANHEKVTDGVGSYRTVTRLINVQLGDKDPQYYTTQTITLHRAGDRNLATGEISWGAWDKDTMPTYAAPQVDGYIVQNPEAGSAAKISNDSNILQAVTFQYQAATQAVTTGKETEKKLTRNIYVKLEGQAAQKIASQTITLHRTGIKNLVTGKVSWDPWTAGNLPAYVAPKEAGYTVLNADAAPSIVVDGSKDTLDNVTFNYSANKQKVPVNYIDEETQSVIRTVPVNGKTGQTVSFNAYDYLPAGWTIVPNTPVPTSFTFGSTPLKDAKVLIHHNENMRYQVSIPAGDQVTTHVGANQNVPSLSASKVGLNWSENGKTVEAPDGVQVAWESVPATNKIAQETGTLKITFKDKTSTTVTVPVVVKGATAGKPQEVKQNTSAPAAKTTVNTSTVDQFGITSVAWQQTPSTAVAGANIPGVARVNYSDGTYQDVNVTINVIGVEDGREHHDVKSLYRAVNFVSKVINADGTTNYINHTKYFYRIRYINYAYPAKDKRRVTYTGWEIDNVTSN